MASLTSVQHWDDVADIVVLGFGLAGSTTAITATDLDRSLDVLIVEKMPEGLEGGNSRASGQALFCPRDKALLKTYQQALNHPNPIPEDLLDRWCDEMVQLEPWLGQLAQEVGSQFVRRDASRLRVEFPELPGSAVVEYNASIEPGPAGVWNAFRNNVARRPIRIRYGTRAVEFVQDPDTLEVFGVIVNDGERKAIAARKAVVICMGGYASSIDILRNYHGCEDAVAFGGPGNTGDGIHMLQRAGADLWHMKNFTHSGGFWPAFRVPAYSQGFLRTYLDAGTSFLEIAADGRRFHNEAARYSPRHFKRWRHGKWIDAPHSFFGPVHMIFDDAMLRHGPLAVSHFTWNGVVEGYKWSADNSAEVERGWIVVADSIPDLAAKIGRDPGQLAESVAEYNKDCAAGIADAFGRPPEALRAIVGPPYYAAEVVPGVICTTGGGRRNVDAQVLDTSGRPIPRLYEAGELGSIISNLYQNGSFLTECMVFGRIAGRSVLRERSWRD